MEPVLEEAVEAMDLRRGATASAVSPAMDLRLRVALGETTVVSVAMTVIASGVYSARATVFLATRTLGLLGAAFGEAMGAFFSRFGLAAFSTSFAGSSFGIGASGLAASLLVILLYTKTRTTATLTAK